jgi:hypothetical protein
MHIQGINDRIGSSCSGNRCVMSDVNRLAADIRLEEDQWVFSVL